MFKNFFFDKSIPYIITIFICATIFSFLVGSGLYGYGVDFNGGYSKGFEWNRVNATGFDYWGYKIATLKFFEYPVGVYITTFILTLSSGFLIKEFLKLKKIFSLSFFIVILTICVHTWPIIMSTSNAMRQGLTMSFFFLSLVCTLNKRYYWMALFSTLSLVMHKSGPFFFSLILISNAVPKIFEYFQFKQKLLINFLLGLLMFLFTLFVLKFLILPTDMEPTRIIKNDFRLPFLIIAVVYIMLSFVFKSFNENSLFLSLYYFSFISPAILFCGLNWQYERLGMMMLIPYLMSYGIMLRKNFYKIYLVFMYLALLFLTIITDMYSYGLKH